MPVVPIASLPAPLRYCTRELVCARLPFPKGPEMEGLACRHLRHATVCALLTVVALAGSAEEASAQRASQATTPGGLRAYSTLHSIGVEWDISGDDNVNATVTVGYRRKGLADWREALPLVRVKYNGANMLAGSLLFLTPATEYEVLLTLNDADGGQETRIAVVGTRRLPVPPTTRTLHVAPGAGGGSGTDADPFLGIGAAQASAKPGDRFLLRAGDYGGRVSFSVGGTATDYVMWKAAGDGDVVINGIDIAASHVWVEGVTVRNQSNGLMSTAPATNVVVTRCTFLNNHYSIYLQQGGEGWYIADNTIVGDTPATTESFAGEGIELNQTAGHTVAHNSITNVADGISYPLRNVDIFGNDIFDTSDDGIEGDYGYANVRVWSNRIHNAVHNGFSFQPQNGAPWYLIRNQIIGNKEAPLKFRTTDRFVLLHNTFVNWGPISCCNDHHLLRAFARNNLWISVQGGQMWNMGSSTSDLHTNLDYDGFDWGTVSNPFKYGGTVYTDLPTFVAGSQLQVYGLHLSKTDCFETLKMEGPSPKSVPPQVLTLKSSCSAIDAGDFLANVNDEYAGARPDIGAYEWGQPEPLFGPRPRPTGGSAPIAHPQSVTTPEDTSVGIVLTGSDADGDALSFTIATPPANGSVSGTPPNVTYTPAANYYGPDSFSFRVTDASTPSSTATVSIGVTAVNDAPSATAQSVSTPQDTPVAVTLSASDVDGDSLTFTVATAPTNGSLGGTAPNLTYTPRPAYVGSDSFTFTATDPSGAWSTATVSLTITSASAVSITTSSLPAAIINAKYSTSVAASGGRQPYAWSLQSGSLPPGLVLNADSGSISGTATKMGTYRFVVLVKDATGSTATRSLEIKVTRK